MKKRIIAGTRNIEFTFAGLEPVVFHSEMAGAEATTYAPMHGWLQRLGDVAASAKSEPERRKAVASLVAHYEAGGGWEVRTSTPKQSPAIAELAVKLGLSYADALAKLANDAIAAMRG